MELTPTITKALHQAARKLAGYNQAVFRGAPTYDDFYQEAYLAWVGGGQYSHPNWNWLAGAVYQRLVRNYQCDPQFRPEVSLEDWAENHLTTPSSETAIEALRGALPSHDLGYVLAQEIADRLPMASLGTSRSPVDLSVVYQLRFLEDLPRNEVAERMGVTPEAVRLWEKKIQEHVRRLIA